ncbi:MAG: hypothetical protein V1903_04170 [Bacteroidota bacterium]
MSEETNAKNVRNDEIDLLDLFRRMGRGIAKFSKAIGRGTLISIVFLFRHWLPLGLSLVLSVGASYLLKYISEPFYESELTLRPNSISNSDIILQIKKVQNYLLEDNIPAVSNSLLLPQDEAKNLIGMVACFYIDIGPDGIPDYIDYDNSVDVRDTTRRRMSDRILIYVRTRAPEELPDIRNGIINYITSDSLYQLRNIVRLRHYRELLARYDYDIEQLDSLQKVKYYEETKNMQPQTGGQMIFLQEQKTQLVYPEILSLFNNRQNIDRELQLNDDIVTILSDFSIPLVRSNGGLYYALRIIPGIVCGTLLILIIIANKRKIKEISEKY